MVSGAGFRRLDSIELEILRSSGIAPQRRAFHKEDVVAPVPPHFLSYPVLIEAAGTHGTGFFMSHELDLYVVSAKHVLFKDSIEIHRDRVKLTALGRTQRDSSQYEIECEILFNNGDLYKHSSADVAIVRIASLVLREPPNAPAGGNGRSQPPPPSYEVRVKPGVTDLSPEDSVFQLSGISSKDSVLLSSVSAGADIMLFGYPTSLAEGFFEKGTPLLRAGIVAGVANDDKHIVIDCPVYFGNSGALVLQRSPGPFNIHYTAIGVASRMIPFQERLFSREFRREIGVRYENSGYAIVEPMDRVFELLPARPSIEEPLEPAPMPI